jgi:hypothetical protein
LAPSQDAAGKSTWAPTAFSAQRQLVGGSSRQGTSVRLVAAGVSSAVETTSHSCSIRRHSEVRVSKSPSSLRSSASRQLRAGWNSRSVAASALDSPPAACARGPTS